MKDGDYSSSKNDELPPGLLPRRLSRTLQKYPGLCKCVRKLSLKVQNVNWYENAGGHERLMRLFPSIQEMTLSPPPKEYNFPMSDRLTMMNLDFSYKLRRFWDLPRWTNPTPFDLSKYLSKPTLRQLQFEHTESSYYKPIHTANPGSSAVTHLRFVDWLPHEVGVLASVLPSIKHLRHFLLEVNGGWGGGIFPRALGPQEYGHLLEPHSASLEELVIAYSDQAYCHGRTFRRKESPFMGILADFDHLRRLALPEPFLVSLSDASFHQLLPPRLEELQVEFPMDGKKDVYRQGNSLGGRESLYRHWRMQKLAKSKAKCLPGLNHVIWWFQPTSRQVGMGERLPFESEQMEELFEDFGRVGVKFEWISTPFFKDTPFAACLHGHAP